MTDSNSTEVNASAIEYVYNINDQENKISHYNID